MSDDDPPRHPERWAHFRFAVVGPLLAAPPPRGQLAAELARLASQAWRHPRTGEPTRFGVSTIERWFYLARGAKADPVAALRRRIRKDCGRQVALGERLKQALVAQYGDHRGWSYQLHADNLAALVAEDAGLGPVPSYSTVLRFMKAHGLCKRRRLTSAQTAGARRAEARLEEREVRSFEASHVGGLWHWDFHAGSRQVLTPGGEWATPLVLGIIDDRSRLACHVQWYLAPGETARDTVHGLCQAMMKRGLPRAGLSDNGSGNIAAETRQGLTRLGITHDLTLPYSPHQNGKQEVFWGQLEGRLMAMLEGCPDLTLGLLNEATQAWVELEYNRTPHAETGQAPLARFLAGPEVLRECPCAEALRLAFTREEDRSQRRSDGTVSLGGRRFEVPSRYRHLARVAVRYAAWDLSAVHLVDERTGTVLSRLYPLDRAANADGRRRTLAPGPVAAEPREPRPAAGMAPLLRQLMASYAATGLPPAYLAPPSAPRDPGTEDDP
jgi:transposase InsO family protein